MTEAQKEGTRNPKGGWSQARVFVPTHFFFLIFANLLTCVSMCTVCVPGDQGGQRRVSDPLEVELWMVVTGYWEWKLGGLEE